MIESISKKLAPKGILRVGINMSNFLLVSGLDDLGYPVGLSPDVGKRLAEELKIECKLVPFKKPGLLADVVDQDKWDIGNIAFEKERGKTIDFSNSYVNIDANFLFKTKYNFKNNENINFPGVKVAVVERSAYDLWLTENFKDSKLIRVETIEKSHQLFKEGKVDVLAGLKPKLIEELNTNKDYKLIENPFTFIKQSIGIKKGNPEIVEFLNDFIFRLINEGFIESLLKKYNVKNKLSIPKI
ncbi:transporter substrate-binding domain-containing protein [Candidatus Pelagibacter sp.]|nr:transporter substrate-binding domain-containing protein [Candidatus Pelagibacter sp.]